MLSHQNICCSWMFIPRLCWENQSCFPPSGCFRNHKIQKSVEYGCIPKHIYIYTYIPQIMCIYIYVPLAFLCGNPGRTRAPHLPQPADVNGQRESHGVKAFLLTCQVPTLGKTWKNIGSNRWQMDVYQQGKHPNLL